MHWKRLLLGLGLTGYCLSGGFLKAQDLCWKDTVKLCRIKNLFSPFQPLLQWRFSQEMDYSLSFSDFLQINRPKVNKSNQFSLLQNVRLQTVLERQEYFKFSNDFLHVLGVQFFIDSITRFQFDENSVDTRLDIKIYRNFSSTLNSILTTRIFNDYNYSINDSGMLVRSLNSGFLTPLVWTFSLGFCWNWRSVISLNFGLSSVRLTYVRDKRVYSTTGADTFYGVPRDKPALLEYGFSLRMIIDKTFKEKISWKCELQLFKNYKMPLDISIKNNIDIRITRFLKTSIQTRIYYEESQSRPIQLENLISVGFNLHL